MTPSATETLRTGLPPLSGRLVLAYRCAWIGLAFAAAVIVASSLQDAAVHPAVLTLRLTKSAILISVCAILLGRRANDPVAALLALAFLMWAVSSSFDFTSTALLPQLLDRLRYLLFAIALLLFPDGRWYPRWTRPLAIVSSAVFLLGVAEAVGLLSTRLYLPLAIGCVLGAIAGLVARFKMAESEAVRQQLKWIALGLVTGVGSILSARAGAALDGPSIVWEALFQLGIVVVALGFLVSLLRYRLFDAESAISRSAALAGVTIAVVATFAGTEATIELIGQQYLGMGIGDISAAMAAAVAVVLLNPLHDRISHWADERFQRDLVRLKTELPPLVEHLAFTASPHELAVAALEQINQAIHATVSEIIYNGARIATVGSKDAIPLDETARTIDLRKSSIGLDASIVLGPRPDGSVIGSDDLQAVEAIVPALRRALDTAMTLQTLRQEIRDVRLLRSPPRAASVHRGHPLCQPVGD